MPRYIAFLRAINVGGHTVKMERLRQIFSALGFTGVESFIASGNVSFETEMKPDRILEQQIENSLREALGYDVATFVRTEAELLAIVNYQAFPQPAIDTAGAFNIAFLHEALEAEAQKKLMALKTASDDFHAHEREIYWLCRTKQSESTFSNAVLEKTIRKKATLRGVNTLKRMAAIYAPT